jgi:hypothetical protein
MGVPNSHEFRVNGDEYDVPVGKSLNISQRVYEYDAVCVEVPAVEDGCLRCCFATGPEAQLCMKLLCIPDGRADGKLVRFIRKDAV